MQDLMTAETHLRPFVGVLMYQAIPNEIQMNAKYIYYGREKVFDHKHGVSHNVIEHKVCGIVAQCCIHVDLCFFHARFDDR